MKAPADRRSWQWAREIAAGAASALSVLPVPITLGLLVFAPLGADAAAIGIPAAFSAIVVGGVVVWLLGGTRLPTAGPTSATALILAALVSELVGPPLAGGAAAGSVPSTAAVVAIAALAVTAAGLLMVVLGLLRLASAVALVPRPVLAGFMNGVALLIALSQLPTLLGVSAHAWHEHPWDALQAWTPATVALGVGSIVLGLLLARLRPTWPAALVVLLVGTLAFHALRWALPGLDFGGVLGVVPAQLPGPTALLPLLQGGAEVLQDNATAVAGTVVVLAVIGSLESSLNVAAVDQQTQDRSDLNRNLQAHGIATLAVGLCGGLAAPHLRLRAMVILGFGGRTPLAALSGSLSAGLLLLAATALLAVLPRVVLAAIMLLIALSLIDRWWLQRVRQWWAGERAADLGANVAVGVVVMLVTVFAGFVVAVGLGVLLAMALFVRATNRALVRRRWRGTEQPSRCMYLPEQDAVLREGRAVAEGLEVEGALYFGSVERLDRALRELRPATRFAVLDLRRVSALDASGANLLVQVAERTARRDVRLLLAGLQPAPLAALRAFGGTALADGAFPDADRAMEAVEHALLAAARLPAPTEVPLADSLLMRGLDARQAEVVAGLLTPQHLAPGETLFAEGDAGDALYVVTMGTVTVVGRGARAGGSADALRAGGQRFLSASAGMMFGELALLDGGGRTGDAVAQTPVLLYRLSQTAIDRLRADDPALAATLYRNIAIHVSQRLRAAVAAWRADVG